MSRRKIQITGAVAILAIVSVGVIAAMRPPPPLTPDDRPGQAAAAEDRTIITLSPEKLRSAGLHLAQCRMGEMADVRTAPGRIMYNEASHVEIKAPVQAVVKDVLASPEQIVKRGDRLLVLSSPEIGMARDAIAQGAADLALIQREADRAEQIAANVDELLEFLVQHPDMAALEASFRNKSLGPHRDILAEYSKLLAAEAATQNSSALGETGIISRRSLQERRSNREVAKAAYETACELARFETAQAKDKARAARRHAERMLAVARQRLESLGGDPSEAENVPENALSELVIRAPFDGTVVERMTAATARVAAGQPLFGLANTDTLWVSAEIAERDWNALDGQQREMLVRAPSLPNSETPAHVKFAASKVSAETRTLSIVGELDNRAQRFRAGMFVWVSVPMSPPRRVLGIPAGALVQHEAARFVFVADGPNAFRRVDVTTGQETPEWIEIIRGLNAGQRVVDAGTFALKSELLLERE